MRVLICGGRDYADRAFLFYALNSEPGISFIIHGGAPGADTLAEEWAKEHAIPWRGYLADWAQHGRAAGPMRNRRMLEDGKPDVVFAFPGGRGTADMMRQARKAGVRVVEFAG